MLLSKGEGVFWMGPVYLWLVRCDIGDRVNEVIKGRDVDGISETRSVGSPGMV